MPVHGRDGVKDPFQESKETISVVIGISQAFACMARVWLTRFGTAGEMYFGGRISVIGWVFMSLWSAFVAPYRSQSMTYFWLATTALMLVHRLRGMQLRRRGYRPHSQFVGYSRLRWRPLEPLFTGICGMLVVGTDRVLGLYLIWAAISLAISSSYSSVEQGSMVRQMSDARAQHEWLQEQTRNWR